MSIIHCPECGKGISDQIKICNNCGFPLEKSTVRNSIETIIPLVNHDADNNQQEDNVQFAHNKKRNLLVTICVVSIILVIGIIIFINNANNAKSDSTQISNEEARLDLENVKEKLSSNIEYVKKHIVGTWKTSDGTILEIYSNGFMINYTPQQNETLDAKSFIISEIKSTGYNGYTIPDISSYSESDLQSYSTYLDRSKNTDKIGISIQMNFFGVLSDKFVLCEFQSNDSLIMGDIAWTRIEAGESDISDEITGLYINEKDKTLALQVIEVKNTNRGYFEWNTTNDGVDGSCTISNDEIVLSFSYAEDFVFERQCSCLVEIGSNGIQGSNLQYKKISNLTYCGQLNASQVSDIENNSDDNNAFAESNSPDNKSDPTNAFNATVSAQGGLFLREEPSTNGNKITLMPDGSTVRVSKVEGNWAYVTYNDMVGWCAKEYIGLSERNDKNPLVYDDSDTSESIYNDLYKEEEIIDSGEQTDIKVSIGDTISFGKYNWKVLDIKGDTALIITEYIIGRTPYNNELEEITWENCSLRNYLNNEFYNSFSESDRNRIVEVTNSNSNNPQYNIPGGNPTNDKVFLLSIEEANVYDITIPEYVMLDIVWWLRSPGDEKTGAAGVYDCGIVNVEGYYVDGYGGVRPALWLKLNS